MRIDELMKPNKYLEGYSILITTKPVTVSKDTYINSKHFSR